MKRKKTEPPNKWIDHNRVKKSCSKYCFLWKKSFENELLVEKKKCAHFFSFVCVFFCYSNSQFDSCASKKWCFVAIAINITTSVALLIFSFGVVCGIFPLNHLESMEEGQNTPNLSQSILVFVLSAYLLWILCVWECILCVERAHIFCS